MDKNKLKIENKRKIEAMAKKLKAEYGSAMIWSWNLLAMALYYLWNKRRAFLKRLESRCEATARNCISDTMLQSIQFMIT